VFVERGRPHLPYLRLTIGCRATGEAGWHSTEVVFDRIGPEWHAFGVIA
jgi:hypothetical protein